MITIVGIFDIHITHPVIISFFHPLNSLSSKIYYELKTVYALYERFFNLFRFYGSKQMLLLGK